MTVMKLTICNLKLNFMLPLIPVRFSVVAEDENGSRWDVTRALTLRKWKTRILKKVSKPAKAFALLPSDENFILNWISLFCWPSLFSRSFLNRREASLGNAIRSFLILLLSAIPFISATRVNGGINEAFPASIIIVNLSFWNWRKWIQFMCGIICFRTAGIHKYV